MNGTAVEEIKAKLEIVPLISEYVQVKKTGASFMAVCPFHGEKTASLHVSPDKQMWYCHGCGEGGDIFGFVMRIEGVDFKEAMRMLAAKAGVTLSADDARASTERQTLIAANTMAAKYWHQVLLKSPQAAVARAYVERRLLKQETIEDWIIGFSPDSWDATLNVLKERKFTEDQLFKAGIISKSEKTRGYFDRFRGRLMFPIRDTQGNVVGFTARIMPGADGKDPKDEAKYINTTATPVYNKSHVLFGLDMARQAMKKLDLAVVVEGNMDVIASHQAGVKNVVGSSGTSFTDEQLKLIKRFTSRLVLSFDNDPAGETAARRSIDAAVAAGFAVRILRIPPGGGKDPDDCIRKDPDLWRRAIAEAVPFMEWYLTLIKERTDKSDPDKLRDASESYLREIAKLTAPVERSHWIRQAADFFDTPESALFERVQKLTGAVKAAAPSGGSTSAASSGPAAGVKAPAAPSAQRPRAPKTRDELVAQHILALIFQYPTLGAPVADALRPEMLPADLQDLYKAYALAYAESRQRGIEPEAFRQTLLRAEDRQTADRVAIMELLAERTYGGLDADARRHGLLQLIGELKHLHISRRQRELTHAMQTAEKAGDMATIERIQEQLNELMV
ncbi:MAG: hypothetical protein RLZZ324_1284 [Candidatus Parcubacteria bacterium]|jgi:DNA primase